MLAIEADDIVKLARQFWNKAQPFELTLLKKQIVTMDADEVTAILESARLDTKFNVFPLKDINDRLNQAKKKNPASGSYITCYALNPMTGKSIEVNVLSQSNDGAKVEMGKYMLQWGMDPVDYILYISEECLAEFLNARHEAACQLNPKIEKTVERLKEIGISKMIDSIANKF